MKTKAIIDFSSVPGAQLGADAQTMHDAFLLALATFPDLPEDLPTFQTPITNYGKALSKKNSGAYDDTLDSTIQRHGLEGTMGNYGSYVNIVANGNPVIVALSGIASYTTGAAPDYSPPAAPTKVVIRQGDLSGSLVARYTPDRPKSINQGQINSGDPNNAAGWSDAGLFSGGKATISGIVPGTTVWVRFRTVGLNNVMGEWSDPIKLMVT